MNINELESMTGISKQNIRFYEKKGLVHPARNEMNNYREYTQEDVKMLQIIKVLRKLDMPIEDIRKIMDEETSFDQAIQMHLDSLLERKSELESCISICRDLRHEEFKTLDADAVLLKMDEMEKKKGGIFMTILNDYKQVKKEEAMRTFTFRPDTMVMNPREFTDALLAYADENEVHLVITKEGMYPVFEIDGIEYTAERVIGRFGAVIHCTMTHPEMVEDGSISQGKRKIYRFISGSMLAIMLVLFIVLTRVPTGQSLWMCLLMAVILVPVLVWTFRYK